MLPDFSVLSVCPVLSVTLVYCGQALGRMEMKLGMHAVQVDLGPGHIVLDGDPAVSSPTPKGHSPQFSADMSGGQIIIKRIYKAHFCRMPQMR